MTTLEISAPGRICLFGEHQDYLLLPVLPCAISLRVSIRGERRGERHARIDLPDIGATEEFDLTGPLAYTAERDYFKSTLNVMRKRGFTFSGGFDCSVHGRIPINAGTSSSSALIVAWVNFLARMSDQQATLTGHETALLAHAAEVLEFGEPGGMMDHFSTAIGGTIFISFRPSVSVIPLPPVPGTFVLGDSGEPKDTKGILGRVKDGVLSIAGRIRSDHPEFDLQEETGESIERFRSSLPAGSMDLLRATVRNHEITTRAHHLLTTPLTDYRLLGRLLDEHHAVLRDALQISTRKIEAMLAAAKGAGAYGGKINGSGGGGCMFVYAPDEPERVCRAIEGAGGRAYVVRIDEGTRVEQVKGTPDE